MCTQWMVHKELPLLHSGGGESVMPQGDGRCMKVNPSMEQVLREQISRLKDFQQC